MRVLHYFPDIDTSSGGVSTHFQVLASALGLKLELHLLTYHTDDEMIVNAVCNIHYLSVRYIPKWDTKQEFMNILEEVKPDIFHVNSCWIPTCSYTAMWAKNAGYKVVYSPHGMLEPWIIRRNYWTKKLPAILLFQKRGIKIADIVLCSSHSESNNFLKLGWNNNVTVIGNCVQLDRIEKKSSWKRNKKILFLSRIHVKKGINFLIEATAKLKNELNGYTIEIAGQGDESYVSELKELARKLGVEDMIDFVGPIFSEKKFDLYREADLFVLPTYSENFGIVVAEALACGTPVITTNGTPWRELETEHCGWWTGIGAEPIINAIREFLSKNEQELEEMGQNGRRLVESKYDSKIIAGKFLSMYEKLVGGKE